MVKRNIKKICKKPGDHYEWKKIKSGILIYILESNGPKKEPDIRKYLEKEYNVIDQGTINRHLHDLEKDMCIELIPHKGRVNTWDITKIKNLKNITDNFSGIHVNKYKKSLDIILNKLGYNTGSPSYLHYLIWAFLSKSFAEMCINMDLESIRSMAFEFYLFNKGSKKEHSINKNLNECNMIYIKGKLKYKMSGERFKEIMEELAEKNDEILEEYAWRSFGYRTEQDKERIKSKYPRIYNSVLKAKKNISRHPQLFPIDPKPWVEIFFERFKEKVPELSEISIEKILKTPAEYKKMFLKMEEILSLIRDRNNTFERTYLDLLTDYIILQDIKNREASDEEKDFARNKKNMMEDFYNLCEKEDYIGAVNKLNSGNQENISKVLINHQDVFGDLKEYY